jgi:hypothetical protein
VPAVLTTFTSSAWNAGGSIMTFYFPIGLFLVVAAALFLQLSRPHAVPGRKPLKLVRSGPAMAASAQAAPGPAAPAQVPGQEAGKKDAPEAPAGAQ